jgi:hypothetical protein
MIGWMRRLALSGLLSLTLLGPVGSTAHAAAVISLTGLTCEFHNQLLTIQNTGDQAQSLYHWYVTARVNPDRHEETVFVFNYNDVVPPGGAIFLHSGVASLLLPPRAQNANFIDIVIDYDIVWNHLFGDIATLYNASGQVVAMRACDDLGSARTLGTWPAPPATGGIVAGGVPPVFATTFTDGAPAPPVPLPTGLAFGNPAAPAAIPPGGLPTLQIPPPERYRIPGLTTLYDPSGRPQIQVAAPQAVPVAAPPPAPPALPRTGEGP